VDSADVNAYLKEVSGEDFTAKDFRTWAGTVLAALALHEVPSFRSRTEARRHLVTAVRSVAQQLGNTPAICRKSYVHPGVIEAYLQGRVVSVPPECANGLSPEEAAVLALLSRPAPALMESAA
jgi:DNA topoisomerase-1